MPLLAPLLFVTIGAQLLRAAKLMLVLAAPLVILVITYVLSFLLAPDMAQPSTGPAMSTFFSTSAVVLATILVTLVVQAGLFATRELRPAAVIGVAYIILGELAASASVLPGGSSALERHAFALTASATVGSLAAVLLIALRQIDDQATKLSAMGGGKGLLETLATEVPPSVPPQPEGSGRADGASAKSKQSAAVRIELAPQAVEDLSGVGRVNGQLAASAIHQAFVQGADEKPLNVSGPHQWFSLRVGLLRVIFRPLTEDELRDHGEEGRGVLIARIVPRQAIEDAVNQLSGSLI